MYTSVRKRWTVRSWAPRHLKWTCSSLRLVTIENFLFLNSSRQYGMGPSWSLNPQKSWPDLQEGGTRLESPSKEKIIQDLAVAGAPPAFVRVTTNAALQEQPRLRPHLWAFRSREHFFMICLCVWFEFHMMTCEHYTPKRGKKEFCSPHIINTVADR